MNHIPRKVPPARSAFTLIELLVVIAIIGILASMILATAGYVQEKAARSRAEAEIAALSAALESYKVDNGDYPLGTNAVNAPNKFLMDALMPTNTGTKVYFEFNKGMTNTVSSVVDPFGATYRYQYPGNTNRSGSNFFDLWSAGKKPSETNEAKWIKNW